MNPTQRKRQQAIFGESAREEEEEEEESEVIVGELIDSNSQRKHKRSSASVWEKAGAAGLKSFLQVIVDELDEVD